MEIGVNNQDQYSGWVTAAIAVGTAIYSAVSPLLGAKHSQWRDMSEAEKEKLIDDLTAYYAPQNDSPEKILTAIFNSLKSNNFFKGRDENVDQWAGSWQMLRIRNAYKNYLLQKEKTTKQKNYWIIAIVILVVISVSLLIYYRKWIFKK